MIQEIQRRNIPLRHITYVSDGASSQYKNCKNFYDLTMHEQDFGITADWAFFATSHGKGVKALNRIFSGHSIISIMEEENLITIDLIRLIR